MHEECYCVERELQNQFFVFIEKSVRTLDELISAWRENYVITYFIYTFFKEFSLEIISRNEKIKFSS
jgi:hypothetical protein